MNILAIGATGFIGKHVVTRLSELGHTVAVLHRGETHADLPTEVRHLAGDRDTLAAAAATLKEFAPDVVLDMIPYTERQARELVAISRGLARRLVVVSSADVYRNYDGLRGKTSHAPDPVPLREDAPLREGLYPYRGADIPFRYRDDYEKILVESVVLGVPDLPGTVLRLPAVYGPGDPQRRISNPLRRMDDGRSAILMGERQARWRWTRGYVENVAAAIALAATDERAAGRTFNVGDEHAPTEREWIERIGAAAGWKGTVVTVLDESLPDPLRSPFDWRYHLATDTRRIREILGFGELVSEKKALERAIEWERGQPRLETDYAPEEGALKAILGA